MGVLHLTRLFSPQDPVVLSGPLRSTLDPFDEYTDEEVLESLRRVQLLSEIDESAAASLAEAGQEPEDVTVRCQKCDILIEPALLT